MKKIFLVVGLMVSALAACAQDGKSMITFNGHRFDIQFLTELQTNKIQNPFLSAAAIEAVIGYPTSYRPPEKPFPRVTETSELFDVASNTAVLFILDGTTNRVVQSSVVIGRIERKRTETILTATNVVESETFGPPHTRFATNVTVVGMSMATNVCWTNKFR